MQTCREKHRTPSSSRDNTDERGSASFNWDLSAKRATCRARLSFSRPTRPWPDTYGSYFAASAYSKFRPINPAKVEAA